MPRLLCSSSTPLFLDTLQSTGLADACWGHLYPEGMGTGTASGFQPPMGWWWWVAGRCQAPKIPLRGQSLQCWHPSSQPGLCCFLLITASTLPVPCKAPHRPCAKSPPVLSPLSVPGSPVPCSAARLCWGCATGCVSWLCPSPPETCCGHLPGAAAGGDHGVPPFFFPFSLPFSFLLRRWGASDCSSALQEPLCPWGQRFGPWALLGHS